MRRQRQKISKRSGLLFPALFLIVAVATLLTFSGAIAILSVDRLDDGNASTENGTSNGIGQSGVRSDDSKGNEDGTSGGDSSEASDSMEILSDIKDFKLKNHTVPVGTTVTWLQRDRVPHTTTSGRRTNITGLWDSPVLRSGDSFSHTFTQIGSFSYFCRIHPFTMNAEINVVKAEPDEDPPSATDGIDIDVKTGGGDGNAVTTTIKPKDDIKPGYYRIRWLIVQIRG